MANRLATTGPFELKVLGKKSESMMEMEQLPIVDVGSEDQKLEKRDSLISPGIDNFLDSKYQDRARNSVNSSVDESCSQ